MVMSWIHSCDRCDNLFMLKNVESAKGEIEAFEEAERELMLIEEELRSAEAVSFSF